MPAFSRVRQAAALPFLLAAVLVGSLFALVPHADAALPSRAVRVGNALDIVRAQKGDPYVWGASGPGAFDCSGLVYYSFRKAGLPVPRTASAQAAASHRIKRSEMRKGDLVFFYGRGGVYHVGVYAGWDHGRRVIIHAPRPGQSVKRERIWTSAWFPGTLR